MTPHLHAPSRVLPDGCRVQVAAPVVIGEVLHKRCRHKTWWTGEVRASAVVPTVAVIKWQPDPKEAA